MLYSLTIKTNLLHYTEVADKSLARPDWINNWKVTSFSSNAEVIAAAETWLEGQPSDFFFLGGLQKLEFGRSSLFLSLSG